jgi:dTDP-4-amino-4,6-dideoxygalactose transaminase
LDDIRAALGVVQLAKMPDDLVLRARLRGAYEEMLREFDEVVVPFSRGNNEARSNHIMPIVLRGSDKARRDKVRGELQELGVQTSVHYPPAHKLSTFSAESCSLPVTEQLGNSLITLPLFKLMSQEQLAYVVESLKTVLSR